MTIKYTIQKDISQVSKMDNKKQLILRLPEDLFSVLKDFKIVSGISYTNQIYTAIVWYFFNKGLLDLGWLSKKHAKNGNGKKEVVLNPNIMDESLKFCHADGGKCEIPIIREKC